MRMQYHEWLSYLSTNFYLDDLHFLIENNMYSLPMEFVNLNHIMLKADDLKRFVREYIAYYSLASHPGIDYMSYMRALYPFKFEVSEQPLTYAQLLCNILDVTKYIDTQKSGVSVQFLFYNHQGDIFTDLYYNKGTKLQETQLFQHYSTLEVAGFWVVLISPNARDFF